MSPVPPLDDPEPARRLSRDESADDALEGERDLPRVLLCDHRGEGLVERAEELAAFGFRVERATTLQRSLEILRESPPDAIVLDPLARGGSVELEAIDRQREAHGAVPLVVVADPADPSAAAVAARGLRDFAWDLARRDAPGEEMLVRLSRLLRMRRALGDLETFRHRASHDDRTDLLRPQAFDERLTEHFSATRRHGLDMALVLIDLDRFGEVNKRFDHVVGDRLLTLVAEEIQKALRAEDVAGRLGGDEFAILLPYTKKLDASRVVNRLQESLRQIRFRAEDTDLAITTSVGFETFDGRDLDDVATLRLHAERALRAAKRQGGDRGLYYRSLDKVEDLTLATE